MTICKCCGKEYFGKRSDSFYCSPTCKKRIHYLKNKELYILKAKLWSKDNLERKREICKKHNNKKETKERNKEYQKKNKKMF